MYTFDLILIILIVLALIYGYRKGLVKQLSRVAGLIGGGILACLLSAPVISWLLNNGIFNNEGTDDGYWNQYTLGIIVSTLLFILGYIFSQFASSYLTAALDFLKLNLLNKVLGSLFNAAFIIVVVSIFMNLYQSIKAPYSASIETSLFKGKMANTILKVSPAIFRISKFSTPILYENKILMSSTNS